MNGNPKFAKKTDDVCPKKVMSGDKTCFDLETEEGYQKMLMLAFNELLETKKDSEISESSSDPCRMVRELNSCQKDKFD